MAGHYIDNKKFYEAIVAYRESATLAAAAGIDKPIIPNYIASCIMLIARNLATKHQFSRYSYIEDMIGDAVYTCVKYFDLFDPAKSTNPFSYFTQVVYYSFLGRLSSEQKQRYIKAIVLKNTTACSADEFTDSDSVNGVIEAFEGRMSRRKAKAAERTAARKLEAGDEAAPVKKERKKREPKESKPKRGIGMVTQADLLRGR